MLSNICYLGSNTTVSPEDTSGPSPMPGLVVMSVLLAAIWSVAMIGNTLACIVIYRSRRLQSTTNFFIVSLAWADITLAVFTMPYVLAQILGDSWPFSDAFCPFVRFVQYLVPGANDLVFVAIAVDRFYTILEPLRFTVTRGRARRMVLGAWIVATVLASPACYFYSVEVIDSTPPEVTICQPYVRNTTPAVTYFIVVFLFILILPALGALSLYIRVARFIWRAGIGGHPFLQRTTNSVPRAKVKMVKMLMILTALTFAFTAPQFFVQLIQCAVTDYVDYFADVNTTVYIAVVWLYFASTASKPALYVCLNSNFRRGCKEVFCVSWLRCCCRRHAYIVTTSSLITKKNHVGVTDPMDGYAASSALGSSYGENGTKAWTSLSPTQRKESVYANNNASRDIFLTGNGERSLSEDQTQASKRIRSPHRTQEDVDAQERQIYQMHSLRQQEPLSAMSKPDPGLVSYV